jgi:hypothetical protein
MFITSWMNVTCFLTSGTNKTQLVSFLQTHSLHGESVPDLPHEQIVEKLSQMKVSLISVSVKLT